MDWVTDEVSTVHHVICAKERLEVGSAGIWVGVPCKLGDGTHPRQAFRFCNCWAALLNLTALYIQPIAGELCRSLSDHPMRRCVVRVVQANGTTTIVTTSAVTQEGFRL